MFYNRFFRNDEDVDLSSAGLVPAGRQEPLTSTTNFPLVHSIYSKTGYLKSEQPKLFPDIQDTISARLLQRELCGKLNFYESSWLGQHFLPQSNHSRTVASLPQQIFCGQYSADGKTFMSACQDRQIRLYNSDTWELQEEITATEFRWSILDCAYAKNFPWIIYSSWVPSVHLCKLLPEGPEHHILHMSERDRFGIFTVRFSGNSREVLAGCSDYNLYGYDIEHESTVFSVTAHDDDINAIEYADSLGHIVLSGSDDTFIKVWDRRSLNPNNPTPVGVFVGHLEGITFLNASADGNYVISNSKDQSIKLWDFRKMENPSRARPVKQSAWDYRYGLTHLTTYQVATTGGQYKHKQDVSVMTYRGHSVERTLIRSYFSPAETTGQKYIYCGSSNGKIFIYDVLTGKIVNVLKKHRAIVRDVSWHPYLPRIVSSSWDCKIKEWNFESNS